MTGRKILIIEDTVEIRELIELHLRDQGYDVQSSGDGDHGLKLAKANSYDLIVLDLMLPSLDGLQVCSRLRAQHEYTPILMLTAKTTELDRVVGLEMGADDYLTKPFSVHELLARAKAIFRRCDALAIAQTQRPKSLDFGELSINLESRMVLRDGLPVDLTSKEFNLLVHFASAPGRVYSRNQILDQVWGHHYAGYEHTVNSHINRLRAKIERDPSHPRYILTVRGAGYKFGSEYATEMA